MALQRKRNISPTSPHTLEKHSEEVGRASTRNWPCWHPDLRLPRRQHCEKINLFFKSPSLWYLLWQPELTNPAFKTKQKVRIFLLSQLSNEILVKIPSQCAYSTLPPALLGAKPANQNSATNQQLNQNCSSLASSKKAYKMGVTHLQVVRKNRQTFFNQEKKFWNKSKTGLWLQKRNEHI